MLVDVGSGSGLGAKSDLDPEVVPVRAVPVAGAEALEGGGGRGRVEQGLWVG